MKRATTNTNPFMMKCHLCGTPTRMDAQLFNLDIEPTCQTCEHKIFIAAKLGRDINDNEAPARKSDYIPRRTGAKGWDIPGIEQMYFAALYSNGGMPVVAARDIGFEYGTINYRRTIDEEFAKREREVILAARQIGVNNVEQQVYKLAMGELLTKVYDEESYDLEIPPHIDPDELTLDQLVKVCKAVPRQKGFKLIPPNFQAMVRYLNVYHPEWKQAKKDAIGDVEKFVDKMVEKLRPIFVQQYGEMDDSRLKSKLMQFIGDEDNPAAARRATEKH